MSNQRIFGTSALGGCVHQFSWPRRSPEGDYYQVCVLCGDEYGYDWDRMRRLGRKPVAAVTARSTTHNRVVRWISRARRIRLTGPVRYRELGGEVWTDGEVKNISKSGVLFVGTSPTPEGTRIELELDMPPEITGGSTARRVKCDAEIMRTENGEHGIVFGTKIFDYTFIDSSDTQQPSCPEQNACDDEAKS